MQGNERKRISVVLCVLEYGHKLQQMLLVTIYSITIPLPFGYLYKIKQNTVLAGSMRILKFLMSLWNTCAG